MIQGTIIRVAGPVVDVQFAAGRLPALQEALTVTAEGTERTREVACKRQKGTTGEPKARLRG